MKPFLSIIIPLYNKENYIEKCLNSVVNQIFKDYEVIIVNDCSTDNGLQIAQSIANKKFMFIEHETNKGLSATRNTGIKNANSNYLVFLDADDIWHSNYLEKIYLLITNFPEAKVFTTNYFELYENDVRVLPATTLKNFKKDGLITNAFEANLGQPFYCCCSMCIEKSVFENVGYFDEQIDFAEDVDFFIRVNLKYQVAFSPVALVDYNIFSENQITNSSFKNKTITNFLKYEKENQENISLKKYLDFHRYIIAKKYKLVNDVESFKKMKNEIDFNNLNYKQIILLNLPSALLNLINFVKTFFVKNGIRISTYH